MSLPKTARRLTPPAVLLVALVLSTAAPAQADVGETIILRCTHNESLRGFSQADYRKALKELEADTEEYSDCASMIHRAQLAGAGGKGGPTGTGTGTSTTAAGGGVTAITPSAAESQALTDAAQVKPGPVNLGGGAISPGVVHANISSAFSTLPTPILAVLALLVASLAGVGAIRLRNRIGARRTA